MSNNLNYILLAGLLIFGRPQAKEEVIEETIVVEQDNLYETQYEHVFSMLKDFEGYAANAFWDVDNWRYGYGTTAQYKGQYISVEDADAMAREEYNKRIERIKDKYPHLDEWQTLIIAAFHYNVANIGGDLHAAIMTGDNEAIAKQMKKYKFAGRKVMRGLVERRNAEIALLNTNGDINKIQEISIN